MARKITTLAPWFGSNRTLAENVGALLTGCRWIGIPFAGGMSELAYIDAPTLVVSDLHRWIINLARVVQDDTLRPQLIDALSLKAFHPDELARAQQVMKGRDIALDAPPCLAAAVDYFVCAWMGRSAIAGTDNEFSGSLPTRWNANGGDSNTRYRSAVASLEDWAQVFQRCNFHVRDAFEFLAKVIDSAESGVYCDPPFPGPGDAYKHTFGDDGQRRLADTVSRFTRCRVVMRFYDVPLIRELYPESAGWKWHHFDGRKQTNELGPEVLLVR